MIKEMSKMYRDRQYNGFPSTTVLELAGELMESWDAARNIRAEIVRREKVMQEEMAAVEDHFGLRPDPPFPTDAARNTPPNPSTPLPIITPPTVDDNNTRTVPPNHPPPLVPTLRTPRQPTATRHEDIAGNHVRPIPANAPPTPYVPPSVNCHRATRASVTTRPAARPNIIRARPSSRLTFDDDGLHGAGANWDGTRRATVQERHLDLVDLVNNGHTLAGASMDRLDTLMDRMGEGVNQTQMLNNLGGFMAAVGACGENGLAQRDEALAISSNILAALNRQYGNQN